MRSRFVVGLLLLTLVLAAVLAYEAQKAARSHHVAATSALQDHAAFVAWQYAGRAASKLDHKIISPGLLYVLAQDGALEDAGASGLQEAVPEQDAAKKRPDFVKHAFRLNLANGEMVFNGGGAPQARVIEWMRGALFEAAGSYEPDWSLGTVAAELDGRSRILFYTAEQNEEGVPLTLRGFEVELSGLPHAFDYAFESPLLPPSLTGGAENPQLLSVAVLGPAGDTLFVSEPEYPSRFAATDHLSRQYGGLRVDVALRPEIADALIIGGLPPSRLPLLIGLLLLAGGLVAAAIVMLRREVEFARLRAEFVSNVSHELRTPLAQIRMFAETLLLDRVRTPEERRRGLEIIDQEARRLSNLVGNVLLFSRAERDSTRLSIEPTELDPLVDEVIAGFRPLAAAKGVRLETEVEDGIVAPVDSSAVRQVLLNFLDNAVKYGPPGQTVTVGMRRANGGVRLWVDDEGPGVPEGERERVWRAFSRLERERERAVAGTGIGLSVVSELAVGHGGRTWVTDSPGGGARFVVELPLGSKPLRASVGSKGDRARPVEEQETEETDAVVGP